MTVNDRIISSLVATIAAVVGVTGGLFIADRADDRATVEAHLPAVAAVAEDTVEVEVPLVQAEDTRVTRGSSVVTQPPEPLPDHDELAPPDGEQAVATAADVADEPLSEITRFVEAFSTAQDSLDVDTLLETLHPAIPEAYGAKVCENYIATTVGSIADVTVLEVGPVESHSMPTAAGSIDFETTYPVDGEWTIVSTGERTPVSFHIVPVAGGYSWLTTCGT
ncbi:MAG: hypothetical protein OEU32_02315 [Acidimicrobiia bacterium]|nr:hypothetical protein [Acidimicrobiia bacterium]